MRKFAVCVWLLLLMTAVASTATEQKGENSQLRALSGHVFNNQNQPIAKAIVYLKNTKTLMIKTYITDPDGSYRFPALAFNVDFEVYAEYEGARSDTKTVSAFDNRKQIEITLRLKGK